MNLINKSVNDAEPLIKNDELTLPPLVNSSGVKLPRQDTNKSRNVDDDFMCNVDAQSTDSQRALSSTQSATPVKMTETDFQQMRRSIISN